ncbi:T9SS sorting signal type C domain-containing protein [Flavobacterium sp. NST-5]|uniref:T9SS sorting signal type C domain-containing protein n=1 Tax=Flavobacterium ichthyis TaxID=2698827 RepID=A0ABW9Z6F1_9FLAO|nr:T9SS sorting signal type C domain-containing protein [Flavobacterium ichthyis]NBL64427.1 T9SS sorting signal type C domain-containing protein [Flavobacterium ichthyis]
MLKVFLGLTFLGGTALHAQISMPYFENFSSITTANGFPTVSGGAWTRSGTTSNQPTYITNQASYNRSGNGDTKFITFRYDSGTRYYFVGPFNLNAGTSYSPSFLYKADGSTGFGPLELTYGATATAADHTNVITSVPADIVNTTFATFSGSFSPASSGSYFIGIKITANGNPWYITIDDFKMEVTPTCFAPSSIVGVGTSTTSANLSWTAPSVLPADGYEWEVRTSGAGGSGATGLADSGFTAAGVTSSASSTLTASTSYTLYVRSNCGGGDYSSWVSSSQFTTPCTSVTLPTTVEGFNTVGLPACWSATVGSSTWAGILGGSGDISAPYSGAGFMEKNYNSSTAVLTSLPLDFSTVTAPTRISMYMHRHASANVNDQYIVYVNTSPTLTGATQVLSLYSKTDIAPTVPATGWYQNLISIPSSFNGSPIVYVLVEGKTSAGFSSYDLGIDDFRVEYAPTDTPDYVNLQFPASASIAPGTTTTVFGQVYEGGLTDVEPGLSGQAAGIEAWVGVSATNTDPSAWTNWIVASHNAASVSNNDEYQANIGTGLLPGTYYYATRFRLNGGPYRYGGIDASNNGNFWDGVTYNSGVLTVNPVANDDCATATALPIGTEIVTSNVGATLSADAIPSCGTAGTPSFATGGKDVWYSLVVPANVSRLDIETLNNSDATFTDSAMSVYRGACGSLVEIECDDDDSTDGNFSLLNLTNLIPGETLYLRVWGYAGTSGSFKLKTSVPACGVQTAWDGDAWSNGTPVAGIRAVFNGDYNGPGFEACAVDVNGTSQVVITSGSDLNLAGIVTVAATASLTLSNDVNLVQSVTTANVGNVTIQRESAPMIRLDYTLWSSPVSGQNLYAFSPNTLTNRFYVYDTATDNYVTTGLSATTTFAAGRGYGIRAANDHPTTATAWLGAFTGVPRNGNQTFTMTNAGNGFNLVGNPYPSVMDANAFVTANSTRITGTLYFYAHTLGMLPDGTYPAGSNYALWNGTGSTAATAGTAGIPANVPNGKINIGQGFIVKRSGTGALAFNNGMREASHGTPFFRASETEEKHRIWLNLTNSDNSAFSQMLVGYVDGATQAVDNYFDGESFGQVGSFIASKLDNKNFTIQGRALPFSDEDIVDVNFHAETAGNFTISLSQMDGVFAADQSVYIKDIQTGTTHDLKAAPYSFVSNAGTFDNRFQIVYRSTLSTPDQTFTPEAVIAFVKNNALNVMTKNHEMKGITIYDLRGRLLFENNKINAENFIVPNFAPQNQVLLVQVTSQNNEVATVKVIF